MNTNTWKWQEDLRILKGFRLMDDDFMTICLNENHDCMNLILCVLLGNDVAVDKVQTQRFIQNLHDRSIQLDVFARDKGNNAYNLEIQRSDKGAGRRRARYHANMIDVNVLNKSNAFETLPDHYVIFITEHDVIGKGKPIYHIERKILETDDLFSDGSHILYVNGAYQGDDAIGRLMHDFMCTNPNDMYYEELANMMRYYKENKEGKETMCRVIEEMRKAEREETRKITEKETIKEIAMRMLKSGQYAYEQISELLDITDEDIQKIALEV